MEMDRIWEVLVITQCSIKRTIGMVCLQDSGTPSRWSIDGTLTPIKNSTSNT